MAHMNRQLKASLNKKCPKTLDLNISILQNCKNLPKDDKLFLRKLLIDGNQVATQFVASLKAFANQRLNSGQIIWGSMIDQNKKMQIKLRRFIQQLKAQKEHSFKPVQKQNFKYTSLKKTICTHQKETQFNQKNSQNPLKVVQKKNMNSQHYSYPYRKTYQQTKAQKYLQNKRNYCSVDKQIIYYDCKRQNQTQRQLKKSKPMQKKRPASDNQIQSPNRHDAYRNLASSIINNQEDYFSIRKDDNLIINKKPSASQNNKLLKKGCMHESFDMSNLDLELSIYQKGKSDASFLAWQNKPNTPKSKLTSSYIVDCTAQKQNQNLFTDPKILNQCKKLLNKSKIGAYEYRSLNEDYHFNSTFQPNKSWLENRSFYEENSELIEEKVKRLLAGKYSEEIFDYIIDQNVKRINSYARCLFMNYRDFIYKLDCFCVQKCGEGFLKSLGKEWDNSLSNTVIDLPVFAPFSTQYQSLAFEKFIKFIQLYSFTRVNPTRKLYCELDIKSEGTISIENFSKLVEWKKNSQKLIASFRKLVNTYGKWGQHITYWEMYWAKDSQQMKQFNKAYLQKQIIYHYEQKIMSVAKSLNCFQVKF